MIDAGAAAVVGGHPHVTQGAEIYQGRPIIYSLGNFVFDGFHEPETTTGWLLRLTLDKTGVVAWETREARLDEAGTPHPVPGARTPCGKAGDAAVALCANP
jgi:poly-gamma-glutamate synthesis protein (capsule biosynthesis protein)